MQKRWRTVMMNYYYLLCMHVSILQKKKIHSSKLVQATDFLIDSWNCRENRPIAEHLPFVIFPTKNLTKLLKLPSIPCFVDCTVCSPVKDNRSSQSVTVFFVLAPDLCGRCPEGKARMFPAFVLCRHCTESAICFGWHGRYCWTAL